MTVASATNDAATPMPSPGRVALVGALSMAAAMGIGRFAFTPLLPLMQQTQGLALADGAWLAMANYLGYLVGALASFVVPLRAGLSIRCGIVLVAVTTLAMTIVDGMASWLLLRFVAGVASALVMVGVAGWVLVQLAAARRGELGAIVFGAVGLSIALAGGIVYVVGTTVADPHVAWGILGVAAAVIMAVTWRPLLREPTVRALARTDAQSAGTVAPLPAATRVDADGWLMIVCYGIAGFGYIVPATFLPAVARSLVNDPAVFGWVWPAFGLAAAIGTIGTSRLVPRAAPRKVCAIGMLVMALGTALPVVHLSIATLIGSAICVGGTFILVTLAGLQEIRRITQPVPTRGVAALTASFALGQLIGPLLTHSGGSAAAALRLPSAVATVGLVVSATILLARPAGSGRSRSA